jgi:uncharacterized repeat protein (TIGR03803 family)
MGDMKIYRLIRLAWVLAMSAATLSAQVLYNFGQNAGDPLNPQAPGVLAQGLDGSLFSTTPTGGTHTCGSQTCGTVFRMALNGTLTVLYDFDGTHGSNPFSGLTLGTDGNFYGTTAAGGTSSLGTVFKITPSGMLTVLYNFTGLNDGSAPQAPPIQGADGNWYGTAYQGGASGFGTIYTITSSGFATLYAFDGAHGANPSAPLLLGVDGNLWGTTTAGGNGHGTIFKITTAGGLTVLHKFDRGDTPNIVQANDGNFYGTILHTNVGDGSIYQMTPAGAYVTLHNFSGADGIGPLGLTQATDGNLYGVTEQGGSANLGTVWRMSLAGSFTSLFSLGSATGSAPQVVPLQHTKGILYGEASAGGKFNEGTFLDGNLGLKAFAGLLPTTGAVGSSVGILGQGLGQTTGVAFNGTAATFSVESGTFLTAIVPAGATTGVVTVTTSTGTLTSNKQFIVLP